MKAKLLIVGEGQETEPNYFDQLKREDTVRNKFTVTVKAGLGFSPENAVRRAINEKERAGRRGEADAYDEVWCVVDVEAPTAGRRESLDSAVRLAAQHDINMCLSNPSFEVWLLAHFNRTARAFHSCDEVIRTLNTFWRRDFKCDYLKNDDQLYRRIGDHTETAIENAQSVREVHQRDAPNTADANSSTDVYLLVANLTGQTPSHQ